MSIVTISRGSYSRGKEVAEKLAERMGYPCISRDVLLEASEEFDIPEIKLVRALHNPARVLDGLQNGRQRFISYIQSAILQHARTDDFVYHGLAGHYFLRDIPHVLKVRIIADMQDRVAEEMRRENLSEERARAILKQDDEERRKWTIQLVGVDTWDTRLYDIVLCIGRLTVNDAVDVLHHTAQKTAFQATPESLRRVEDRALAARVTANLSKTFPGVDVAAEDGKIFIHHWGKEPGSKAEKRIEEIALSVEGVQEVTFQFRPEHAQKDHVNPFYNVG
jgi:cytidylate kinase